MNFPGSGAQRDTSLKHNRTFTIDRFVILHTHTHTAVISWFTFPVVIFLSMRHCVWYMYFIVFVILCVVYCFACCVLFCVMRVNLCFLCYCSTTATGYKPICS